MRFDLGRLYFGRKMWLAALLTLAFCLLVTPIFSKPAAGRSTIFVVAIIDIKKVASKSKAGRGIEKQAATQNNTSKKELIDLENKIKSMESSKLSGSDPQKIEELQLLLYDMVKEKRFQISEAYRKAIETLETIIRGIVEEVCTEKHIDVVITNEAVVYSGKNCLDITEEVTKRLDERCEEIILKLDEENKSLSEETNAPQISIQSV